MFYEWDMYINNICDLIDSSIVENRRKIKTTENSINKRKTLEEQIKSTKDGIEIAEDTLAYNKAVMKVTDKHIKEKRSQGIDNLNAAIETSRSIIEGVRPMRFELTNQGAKVTMLNYTDNNGNQIYDRVDDIEGSALRAMLSFFCKSAVILTDEEILNISILDEPFSTLSVDTSAKIAPFLSVMAMNSIVILTEQKKEIFVDANEVVFQVYKDKETEISTLSGSNVKKIEEREVPK